MQSAGLQGFVYPSSQWWCLFRLVQSSCVCAYLKQLAAIKKRRYGEDKRGKKKRKKKKKKKEMEKTRCQHLCVYRLLHLIGIGINIWWRSGKHVRYFPMSPERVFNLVALGQWARKSQCHLSLSLFLLLLSRTKVTKGPSWITSNSSSVESVICTVLNWNYS